MANAAIKLDNISNNNRHVGINIDEDTEPTLANLQVNGSCYVSGTASIAGDLIQFKSGTPQISVIQSTNAGAQIVVGKTVGTATVEARFAITADTTSDRHGLYSTQAGWFAYVEGGDVYFKGTANNATNAATASSAVKLKTARTIQGVSFDGTANITLPNASADTVGLVSTGAQTFAGAKSFTSVPQMRQGSYYGRLAYGTADQTNLGFVDYISRNASDDTIQNKGHYRFLEYSYNSTTGTTLTTHEDYLLPDVEAGLGTSKTYYILNNKTNYEDMQVTTTSGQPYSDVDYPLLTSNDRVIVQRKLTSSTLSTSSIGLYPVCTQVANAKFRVFWSQTPSSNSTIYLNVLIIPSHS